MGTQDPDVKRISKEVLVMINHCVVLFVQRIAEATDERQTERQKARGMSEKDVIKTLYSDDKYMFARHVFAGCQLGKQRSDIDGDVQEPPKKKLKMTDPENSEAETEETSKGTITSFFKRT